LNKYDRGSFRENPRGFEYQYKQYGKLKKEYMNVLDYDTLQAGKEYKTYN
jgi:hypothetical protein